MKLTRKVRVWTCQQSHPCPSLSRFHKKTFFSRITSGNSSWQQNAASLAKGAALRWWHRSRRTTLHSYLHKRSEPPAMLRLIAMLQHKRAPGFGKKWMLLVLQHWPGLQILHEKTPKNTTFMEGDRFTVPRGFMKPQYKNGSSKAAAHTCTTQNRHLHPDLRHAFQYQVFCSPLLPSGLYVEEHALQACRGWPGDDNPLGSLAQFPSCSQGF